MSCFMIFPFVKVQYNSVKKITGTRDSCSITVNPNTVKAVSLITLCFTRIVFTTLTNKFKFFLHFNPIFLLSKMGNRRNRRSRRLETQSPERETSEVCIETPSQGNLTLTNVNLQSQESVGETDLRPRLVEPSQISNEIQAWTEIFEQKNNDRITKMREEMENKLDAILMEIKTSKSTSMTTNPRSEINEIENMQPSGSGGKRSMGVNASDNESLDSENKDIPLKASESRELRHPAKPIHQNDTTLDATVIFNEESDEEDYHSPQITELVF